jgi:alkaline phosphatase D
MATISRRSLISAGHEVDNNWVDDIPENLDAAQQNDTLDRFRARRSATFRAYYENMPLRASSVPSGPDMKIFRTVRWGQLAAFHMMDTRQYRDDQHAGDGFRKNVAGRLEENRTITGTEQEKWLLDGSENSTQRWDILGQQVFFTERDRDQASEIDDVSMDGWDGYAASSAASLRAGWTRKCATPSSSPAMCTGTGQTTSRWTTRIRSRR